MKENHPHKLITFSFRGSFGKSTNDPTAMCTLAFRNIWPRCLHAAGFMGGSGVPLTNRVTWGMSHTAMTRYLMIRGRQSCLHTVTMDTCHSSRPSLLWQGFLPLMIQAVTVFEFVWSWKFDMFLTVQTRLALFLIFLPSLPVSLPSAPSLLHHAAFHPDIFNLLSIIITITVGQLWRRGQVVLVNYFMTSSNESLFLKQITSDYVFMTLERSQLFPILWRGSIITDKILIHVFHTRTESHRNSVLWTDAGENQ